MNIAVLGAGNWGTTVALLLDVKGYRVSLWEFNERLAADMKQHRENKTYLKGYHIPDSVFITSSLPETVNDANMIVFVVPSSAMRATARKLADCAGIHDDALLVSLTKGLEYETLKTMTGVVADEVHGKPLIALSGPCIASEVAQGMPTTIVAASNDMNAACTVQDVFMTPTLRVYTSDDPLGVQLGGALKNIIAIAAGICDGLGFGSNAKSALMTRGIVEMRRFGDLLGAKPDTFNGLSGIGDLMTTCISSHSRNRRVGEELVKGKPLNIILNDMVMVAEGVQTTKAVYEYVSGHYGKKVDMPITEQVYGVLFKEMSPQKTVSLLMMRDRKPEHEPVQKR
jgi:glycerol-3-phosphate dehydrogenase (NAD(P)+)